MFSFTYLLHAIVVVVLFNYVPLIFYNSMLAVGYSFVRASFHFSLLAAGAEPHFSGIIRFGRLPGLSVRPSVRLSILCVCRSAVPLHMRCGVISCPFRNLINGNRSKFMWQHDDRSAQLQCENAAKKCKRYK